jgi:translocation and assembly module TamA
MKSAERAARELRRISRGIARRALPLLACGVLHAHLALAANPQPYKVDFAKSGDGQVDSLLPATSQLATLRTTAPVDPYGLIARARGDVDRLNTVLHSFGYYSGSITITINGQGLDDPTLGETLTALPKGTDARVKVTPALGPLYHIGSIGFKGALPPGMEDTLGIKPGDPAIAANVLAAGTTLQTHLQDAGYAFAKVDAPIAYEKPDRHVLDLTYPVNTGPKVAVGDIRIEGLKHVKESLVRRRLLLRTGEPYDARTVEKARQDLLSLGVFSSVSVQLGKAPDAQGRVPVTFTVKESKRYAFGVSAAYSSDLGGSGGINWSDRDVFGGGQHLDVSATAINLGGTASTGLGYDVTIGYTIPDFRRRDQTLHFSVEALRQELQAYAENGQIAGATVSRKLSSVWSATAGISLEHELIGQPGATCPPPPGTKPVNTGGITVCPFSQVIDYNLLLLPIAALYDSTDLPSPLVDPTHGFRIALNFTPTFSYGHSGATFLVSQASVATYFDMHKLFAGIPAGRTVLAAKALAGLAEGAEWYNLPPDQRFYAGGSGTVRGYRYQSVGPQFTAPSVDQNGNPTTVLTGIPQGGTTLEVLDLELRQRIGTNFGFVLFADGGGVSQTSYPLSGDFRIGAGAGVRYYTPIGPLRFDIAVPTSRRANDDRFDIYIGIGQAF